MIEKLNSASTPLLQVKRRFCEVADLSNDVERGAVDLCAISRQLRAMRAKGQTPPRRRTTPKRRLPPRPIFIMRARARAHRSPVSHGGSRKAASDSGSDGPPPPRPAHERCGAWEAAQ